MSLAAREVRMEWGVRATALAANVAEGVSLPSHGKGIRPWRMGLVPFQLDEPIHLDPV